MASSTFGPLDVCIFVTVTALSLCAGSVHSYLIYRQKSDQALSASSKKKNASQQLILDGGGGEGSDGQIPEDSRPKLDKPSRPTTVGLGLKGKDMEKLQAGFLSVVKK